MNTWPLQQREFAAALLDPGMAVPEFLNARGTLAVDRFDVYRNNVHASLIEALVAAFPVCTRLVGSDSFHALAREFLRAHLPRGAALHDYGAQLPSFIRVYQPAQPLPWLADVASLEQAWWQAYGAADATAMATGDLAAWPGDQLLALRARLHPATRLLESAHPACSIWLAHQSDGDPAPVERWDAECALITRPEATVQVLPIDHAAHEFLALLALGATLESAAETALSNHPDFDFGTTLLLAIGAGAIQELHA